MLLALREKKHNKLINFMLILLLSTKQRKRARERVRVMLYYYVCIKFRNKVAYKFVH